LLAVIDTFEDLAPKTWPAHPLYRTVDTQICFILPSSLYPTIPGMYQTTMRHRALVSWTATGTFLSGVGFKVAEYTDRTPRLVLAHAPYHTHRTLPFVLQSKITLAVVDALCGPRSKALHPPLTLPYYSSSSSSSSSLRIHHTQALPTSRYDVGFGLMDSDSHRTLNIFLSLFSIEPRRDLDSVFDSWRGVVGISERDIT